ncbi:MULTISPECIES: glutathione S-transferase family protein [Marinobacter]|uniref:glutathione S-transferase family protein n=3 Tax=Marinobacteraceae TaxID=2887365 RepID=UPI0029439CEF|nr:glutathione S-transferase family protein [Marinobacter salarius]WOI19638.1 glutathione S-transferase family protein [Marinobacter salarius]
MLKLYGTPPTRALRVVWLLNELGLEHELHPVDLMQDEHHQQDFLSLNPAARVPVLVDGNLVLTESAAIQLYLAEKYPQAGFIPETLEDRAQMYRWMFFLVTEVEQPLWRIARHTFVYPDEKRIPQDVELARQECLEMIAVLERHMSEREFMVGDRLSVADFNAAYTLDWANTEEMLESAPRLRDYLKAMYARPTAPPTIAEAFAAMESQADNSPSTG